MLLRALLINVSMNELSLADVARISTGKSHFDDPNKTYAPEDNEQLVRALFVAGHWSIFEFLNVVYLIDAPCYVRDQLIRYRCASYNARSLRKCEPLPIENPESPCETFYNDVALKEYREAINSGAKKEEARAFLPVCAPTQWIVNYNVRELFHVFDQRLVPAAQNETREVVKEMLDRFSVACPLLARLWKDRYHRNHHVGYAYPQ
ncbi:MAG: FAD-dependent thymidylate synthase [Thermoguttaceae bacterium]|nr:FAD-dependent thymidylate synthase [Thermoguttaceae bacterium]